MKKKLAIREIWKIHPIYTEYEISNLGRMRRAVDGKPTRGNWVRCKAGMVLKFFVNRKKWGYCQRSIVFNGKSKSVLAHRLVLEAFVGPCPMGHEVNHKDGDKENNNLNNLEWVTPSQNTTHAYKTGLQPSKENRITTKGELNKHAKLKEGEVWLIRKILEQKKKNPRLIKQYQIARMFRVSFVTISDIKRGRSWSYLNHI